MEWRTEVLSCLIMRMWFVAQINKSAKRFTIAKALRKQKAFRAQARKLAFVPAEWGALLNIF